MIRVSMKEVRTNVAIYSHALLRIHIIGGQWFVIHWEETTVLDHCRGQELLVKKALHIQMTPSNECFNQHGELKLPGCLTAMMRRQGERSNPRVVVLPCMLHYSWRLVSTLNTSRTIGNSEGNKHSPWIVAMASAYGTQMHVPADAYWAISRDVRVLRLVSTSQRETEMLRILLPASIRLSCITSMYLIQPLMIAAGLPTE